MPRKTYVGVNNKAKNVPNKGYVGIANKAKKLLKGYIGDANGKARLFWDNIIGNFWFFYETVANNVCMSISGRTYFKTQNGIAFYAIVWDKATGWVHPFFFSTDEDAVNYWTSSGGDTFPHGSVTYNNETWYWMGFAYSISSPTINPVNIIPIKSLIEISNGGTASLLADDALDILLPCVYSNDFAEDYQIGQTYHLNASDIEKTIRKAVAVWLYKCASYYRSEAWYQTVLTERENLISELLQNVGNNNLIGIECYFSRSSVYIRCGYSNEGGSKDMKINRYYPDYNGTGYDIVTFDDSISHYQENKWYRININRTTGAITRQGNTYSGRMSYYLGCYVVVDRNSSPPDTIYVRILSAGLNL